MKRSTWKSHQLKGRSTLLMRNSSRNGATPRWRCAAARYNAPMNESDILRGQLATERIHAAQVANACLSLFGTEREPPDPPPDEFREASVNYLVWVLSRFEQRDQLLAEYLARQRTAQQPSPGELPALEALEALEGTSHQALLRLQSALTAPSPEAARAAWLAFGQFFNTLWCARRAAIEQHLTALPRPASWRALCALDADSILHERARYAEVAAHLPAGITLLGATSA